MVLMEWRSSRGIILASMMIFLNSGSKHDFLQDATGFPTRYPDLLQDVTDLLYEIIIHRMIKKIKSKLDGTIFFID